MKGEALEAYYYSDSRPTCQESNAQLTIFWMQRPATDVPLAEASLNGGARPPKIALALSDHFVLAIARWK
jgi:hypothetical protein